MDERTIEESSRGALIRETGVDLEVAGLAIPALGSSNTGNGIIVYDCHLRKHVFAVLTFLKRVYDTSSSTETRFCWSHISGETWGIRTSSFNLHLLD